MSKSPHNSPKLTPASYECTVHSERVMEGSWLNVARREYTNSEGFEVLSMHSEASLRETGSLAGSLNTSPRSACGVEKDADGLGVMEREGIDGDTRDRKQEEDEKEEKVSIGLERDTPIPIQSTPSEALLFLLRKVHAIDSDHFTPVKHQLSNSSSAACTDDAHSDADDAKDKEPPTLTTRILLHLQTLRHNFSTTSLCENLRKLGDLIWQNKTLLFEIGVSVTLGYYLGCTSLTLVSLAYTYISRV